MELGARLRQARLDAGLSQRQLCGDTITRNMLSQIENGSARPSMQTLSYLASRLGKPISFFLEEQAVSSGNRQLMDQVRQAHEQGQHLQVLALLENYLTPDPIFDREMYLLRVLSSLSLAQQALAENRHSYCLSLLEQAAAAGEKTPYYTPALERQRLLLLAQAKPQSCSAVCSALPSLVPELLVRARAIQDPHQQLLLLDAAAPTDDPQWHLLRGKAFMQLARYSQAVTHLSQVENTYPSQVLPLLEECYRELEDYKQAYHYACLARESHS